MRDIGAIVAAAFIILLNVAWVVVLIWAVIKLVLWVTA